MSSKEEISYKLTHLPKDWKPARGRGRIVQKSMMTKEQIEEERNYRLEKNRLAAKKIRNKKKRKFEEMEERIKVLEAIISKKNDSNFIDMIEEKNSRIEILEEVVSNQSDTIRRLLEEREE